MLRHFGPSNEFHSSFFLIAAPFEYICNKSRCSNQLCDVFRETGQLFPDAGA